MMRAFLGVDIGTFGSKGVLLSEAGEMIATATREHGLETPHPGWAEHDADTIWWADFSSIARELAEVADTRSVEIAAVTPSAIGPTCLPVDAKGRPLRAAMLYGVDTRATEEIDLLNRELGADRIFSVTGNPLTAQATGPKIVWLRRNEPHVYNDTARFLTATSYLIFRLTGRYVVDAYSAAPQAPLFSLEERGWYPPFVEACCSLDQLPEIVWTTDIVGETTSDAAHETGLPVGTPVVAGTIDAAAEAVSAGVTRPGQLMVMYGSTAFLIQVLQQRTLVPGLWAGVFLVPGRYVLTGGMATTGAITQWFRRGLTGPDRASFDDLFDEAATSPPGSNDLLLLPYFSGERTPFSDPWARGVWAGLSLRTTRGDLFRSILEATAFGIRHHVEAMANGGAAPEQLVAVGGGSRSRLWLQIVSDVCGLRQAVPRQRIGAALGDAFLAAIAAGALDGLDQVADWIELEEPISPDPQAAALYDARFAQYRRLYEDSRDVVHELQAAGRPVPA